jgi:hypothetical protein
MIHEDLRSKFPHSFRSFPTPTFPTDDEASRMTPTRELMPDDISTTIRPDTMRLLSLLLTEHRPLFAKYDVAGWKVCYENHRARVAYWSAVYSRHSDKRTSEAHRDRKVMISESASLILAECYLREAIGLERRISALCPPFLGERDAVGTPSPF